VDGLGKLRISGCAVYKAPVLLLIIVAEESLYQRTGDSNNGKGFNLHVLSMATVFAQNVDLHCKRYDGYLPQKPGNAR